MEITRLAQHWVGQFLCEGDLAIDATVGNGHDTVFLASLVGTSGMVIGFDIQETALVGTRRRLEQTDLGGRVGLVCSSHGGMAAELARGELRRPRAIMFNLGYLPGGDKMLTTRAEETVPALVVATGLLGAGGILTVVIYPGHPEGEVEAREVSAWAERLPSNFEAMVCRVLNRSSAAPFLIAVEKARLG